jgi:hypothetical protein
MAKKQIIQDPAVIVEKEEILGESELSPKEQSDIIEKLNVIVESLNTQLGEIVPEELLKQYEELRKDKLEPINTVYIDHIKELYNKLQQHYKTNTELLLVQIDSLKNERELLIQDIKREKDLFEVLNQEYIKLVETNKEIKNSLLPVVEEVSLTQLTNVPIEYKYNNGDDVIYPQKHSNKRFTITKKAGKGESGPLYHLICKADDTFEDFIPESKIELAHSFASPEFLGGGDNILVGGNWSAAIN